jgi:hypothetical protein
LFRADVLEGDDCDVFGCTTPFELLMGGVIRTTGRLNTVLDSGAEGECATRDGLGWILFFPVAREWFRAILI